MIALMTLMIAGAAEQPVGTDAPPIVMAGAVPAETSLLIGVGLAPGLFRGDPQVSVAPGLRANAVVAIDRWSGATGWGLRADAAIGSGMFCEATGSGQLSAMALKRMDKPHVRPFIGGGGTLALNGVPTVPDCRFLVSSPSSRLRVVPSVGLRGEAGVDIASEGFRARIAVVSRADTVGQFTIGPDVMLGWGW
ncbi:MAG: hypothetical protein AB8H79_11250 [Myxococcota bacterium]